MKRQCKQCVSVLLSVLIVLLSVPFVFGTAAIVDEGSCGEQLQWTLTEDGVLRVTGTGAMEDTPWLDYADEIFSAVLDEGVESICAGAFEDCIALETLDIPASVTLIEDNPLGNCCSLREIHVAADNTNYSCDSAGALLDKAQTTLLRYPGGREEDSYTLPATVTSIESRAFYPSPALQTLVLPGGLLSLKAHALWGCYHLSALTIPDSVTTIGKNALNACFDLQRLSIGSGVSTIGDFALPRFSALQTITVSEENTVFSAVDNVLFSRDGHTLLYYPAGRTETSYTVPDGVTTIAQTAFADNTVLEQLVLPASLEEIAPGALADCSALTEICSASETAVAAASGFRSFLSEDYDVQTLLALYFAFRLWENRDAVLLEEDEIYARLSAITGEDEDELDYDLLYEAATPDQEPNALPAGLTFHAYADSAEAAFCAEHDIPWRAHDFSVVVQESTATCEADGDTVLGCADCPLTETRFVPAHGHSYGEWTSVDENDHARICVYDGAHRITGAHNWNLKKTLTPATCTTPGTAQITCSVCGATKTEPTEKDLTNHADYGTHTANASAATCTEAGYTGDTVCDGCGEIISAGSPIAALGHDFDEWIKDDDEQHMHTCSRCDEEEYANHVWNDGESLTAATCKVAGSVKYTCTVCGATKTEAIEKDPANHADYGTHTVNASAASCTEAGYTGDTVCDGCGEVISAGAPVAALGHDFDEWIKDDDEQHMHTCSRCDEEEYANHVWNDGESLTAATCKEKGSNKFTCTVCGATKTETTEKDSTNHADYGTHIENASAATCTEAGYTGDTVCNGCGAVLASGEEIKALGHDFSAWTDNGENHIRACIRCTETETASHVWNNGEPVVIATCKDKGSNKFTCTVCGATKMETTEKDSTNHADYGTHIENAVAATCTKAGYTGDTVCNGCGAVLASGEEIKALGHDFDEWIKDDDEQHMHTCSRCDEEEFADHVWNGGETLITATCKVAGRVKYTCTVCGATKTKPTEKDPTNHADYGTHTENASAATCTEAGYTGDTVCNGCGAVLASGEVIKALGHDFSAWTDNGENHIRACTRCTETETASHVWNNGEPVTTATCKVAGSVKYTCTVCGATKTEATEKDPTNHTDYGTHTVNASAATCTEAGYTGDTVCDGCGAVLASGEEIKALGHDFSAWTDNGENHIRACTRCTETENRAHQWGVETLVRASTCSSEGETKAVCEVCGAVQLQTLSKAPHTDNNDDGVCDFCALRLREEKTGGCPYCGGTHDGAFGWLVSFFHRILFSLFGAK